MTTTPAQAAEQRYTEARTALIDAIGHTANLFFSYGKGEAPSIKAAEALSSAWAQIDVLLIAAEARPRF